MLSYTASGRGFGMPVRCRSRRPAPVESHTVQPSVQSRPGPITAAVARCSKKPSLGTVGAPVYAGLPRPGWKFGRTPGRYGAVGSSGSA